MVACPPVPMPIGQAMLPMLQEKPTDNSDQVEAARKKAKQKHGF